MKEERGVAVREVMRELAFENYLRGLARQRERRAKAKTKRKRRKRDVLLEMS